MNESNIAMLRAELRKKIRLKRNALTSEQQANATQVLLKQVIDSGILNGVKQFAAYLANDGEINPKALIDYAWQNHMQTYLPVLHPFANGHLAFLQYNSNSEMQLNKYNIAEPKLNCLSICPTSELELVFLPLVAFDKFANRMGMGGGFYDRTFANNTTTKLIGLAHDCQQVEKLPIESWDVPLHAIITPSQTIMI
ncbi:5-formyltetrahydrofolate cyclo-ligase [Catenovulum agarivorans]|uniref:5-formyltetrahydrofolate cyclo-ligase n=1 Tax=Catenovulum agarivorans TaxID=1172192 RepID=UPI0002ED6A73|nr:5-formyltetrahydrofolate cyclo-ligase [Catenovulum agarivorans]